MPLTSVNLLAGFNRDDSPAWSVQDVCNFLPVVADQPGTKTQFKLRTPPGLKPYQRIGPGPIRGAHNAEGRLFVVSGQTLYEVSAKGIGIPRGTVPGVGRVRMAHNQIKNGNQIAIANGQSGYIYSTVTQAFTRITDDGFPGAVDVVFINGYLFWIEPFGRYWLHSDLADGLSYNTLDRGEAESQPDRIVGVAVSQGDVLLFGERTTEFYRNTGQATGTFQSTGTTIDVGCASLQTIQNLDNSVMWLGNDGVIYRLDGLRAAPISTRAIEKAIAKSDWKNAFAFTWEDEGHKVYYITFPDGETYGYDVVVGLWHRRQSFGLKRWRLNTVTSWGRKWVGGDFQDGRLWLLDWDYVLEGDDELIATYTSAEVSDSGNRIGIPEMELLFDVGREPSAAVTFPGQPDGPSISGDAPDAIIGGESPPYASYQYVVSSGTTWSTSLRSGSIPPGLALSRDGVLSGQPTKVGSYSFVVRVTDANGLYADLADSIFVDYGEVIGQVSEWKYLQLPSSDTTDYSGADLDDSGWLVGETPFANLPGHPYAESVGWPPIKNTNWDENTRLWLRAEFTMTDLVDLLFYVFVDNFATVWVNGTQVMERTGSSTTPSGPVFNHEVQISSSHLVVGQNTIAVLGEDMGVYSYMACRIAKDSDSD